MMYIYHGHMDIFIPNMKFLCLTLWLGGVSTDANTADNDDTGQWKKHDWGSLVGNPDEPKSLSYGIMLGQVQLFT